MKILTLVWSVGPGGTERAAVNFAIGYKMFGQESMVLVLGEGNERYNDLVAAGVDTLLLHNTTGSKDDIIKEIKLWAPDIIHIHAFSESLLAYINRLKTGSTKIVETNIFSRPLYHKSYKAIHLSLQLTSWGYWRYTRRMQSAAYRPAAAVIPNIVDTEKFVTPSVEEVAALRQQYNIPSNAFVAGRIGQAHPAKWDEALIEIIKNTIDVNNTIYYLLAGVPQNIKASINNQNDFFKSRVKLIDKIEGDDKLSVYYHSLNCFVHLSAIGESFGYVLTEAMLCGLPVITMLTPFKDNGQFEVVGDKKGGICVTSKKEFVTAVFELYNNNNSRMADEIKQQLNSGWVEKRFSFNAVMPALLDMYKDLLAGKTPATQYKSELVNTFFSFYKTKHVIKACLVKILNTAFFFRLSKFIK